MKRSNTWTFRIGPPEAVPAADADFGIGSVDETAAHLDGSRPHVGENAAGL
ncbi:MAG TPA: hypothetical protein VJP03_02215 [Actinomycetota bacterium]|nr:hypothetical protein [Actinomycetota bacterium]